MNTRNDKLREDLGFVTITARRRYVNHNWFGRLGRPEQPYMVGPLGLVTLGLWQLDNPSHWAAHLLEAARQVPGVVGEVQLASLLACPEAIPVAWQMFSIMVVTVRRHKGGMRSFVSALEAEGHPFGPSWRSASVLSEIFQAPLVLVQVPTPAT